MPAISHQHGLSEGLQIDRGLFAAAAVGLHLIGDLLTLREAAQAGALNRADVDEHVLAARVRLNEAIALLVVEPLHRSRCHDVSSLCVLPAGERTAHHPLKRPGREKERAPGNTKAR